MGGMGNQMFQYAAGFNLARKLDTELVLDLTFLATDLPIKHFTKRSYSLDLFNVTNKLVTKFTSPYLNSKIGYLYILVENLTIKNKFVEESRIIGSSAVSREQKLQNFFALSDGGYLEGYFHDYSYFKDVAHDILSVYDTDKLYDSRFFELEKLIKARTSVSIAIRRGDFLNARNKDKYVQLDDVYYKAAIKAIKDMTADPHFFIFSYDYPHGMDRPFGLEECEYTLVGRDKTGPRFETYLRLQSLCVHNITANSTFSYWGAFLNKYHNKIVIAPSKWENKSEDFNYPPGWVTINV
jgi:hypothetical protein